MLKRAFAIALVSLGACTVDDGTTTTTSTGFKNEPLCSVEYLLTGSYKLGAQHAPDNVHNDAEHDGEPGADGIPDTDCWPVGTWSFTVAPSGTSTCSAAPVVPSRITMEVTVHDLSDPDTSSFDLKTTEPNVGECKSGSSGNCVRLRVDGDGGGKCSAQIELFNDDGHEVFSFAPVLDAINMDAPLNGTAQFDRFDTQQLPEGDPAANDGGCNSGRGTGIAGLALVALCLRRRSRR